MDPYGTEPMFEVPEEPTHWEARLLRRRFDMIPSQQVTVWDWHSEEGVAFLGVVDRLVAAGVDINEIGQVIGLRNFSQRYRMLKKGRP